MTLLDAPVSGSQGSGRAQGELIIFASGPDEARTRVTPLFDALGQRTIWVGAVGAGTRLKLVNNTWLAFAAEAVAASVALARRLGSRPRRWSTRWAAARSCRRGRRPSCNGSRRATSRPSSRCRSRSRTCTCALQAAGDDRSRRPRLPGRRMAAGRGPRTWRPGPDRRHARARTAGRNAMTPFFPQLGVWEVPAEGDPDRGGRRSSARPREGAIPPGMQSAAHCPQRIRR